MGPLIWLEKILFHVSQPMKPLFSPVLLIAALTAFAISPVDLDANGPRVLLLDGKVQTKNIPFEGVRVVVERNGIPVRVVTKDLRHFQLQLDLQQDYVVTFHRESCLSKSLHIDTHVPDQALDAAPFSFPFLVTLEPRPKGPLVRYAVPVGQIYFREEKGDFGYGTNYSLARDRQQAKLSDLPPPAVRAASTGASAEPSSTLTGPTIASPLDKALPIKADRPAPIRRKDAPNEVAKSTRPRHQAVGQDVLRGSVPDGRSEELEVRPTYVAKEVRITQQGHTRVYRKVVHRDGEIRYFCNGNSCSESIYKVAIKH